MRILLVEDDESIAGFMSEFLADEGHVVRREDDRSTACQQLAAGDWDVLVLDPGESPDWSSGLCAGAAPVVLTSAYPWALQRTAAELGVAAVCAKPFDLNDLLATLNVGQVAAARLTTPYTTLSAGPREPSEGQILMPLHGYRPSGVLSEA